MTPVRTLVIRTVMTALVILTAVLLVAPNFTKQELAVTFREYQRSPDGERIPVPAEVVADFIQDRENGLRLYFPRAECRPEASEFAPETHRCILSARFITTARINELVQSHPDLINERDTYLLPHPMERLFGYFTEQGYLDLKIKLGLDLQGGMRAVFRADFEEYLEGLREKIEPEIKSLEAQIARPDTPEIEKNELQRRLQNLRDQLSLEAGRQQQLLLEAKDIIDKRLVAQGLTEPEVRAQPESLSIAVDMPGVANSTDVLAKVKNTVTVEYRIVNSEATARVNNNIQNLEALQRIKEMHASNRLDPIEVEELLADVAERSELSADEGRLFLHWRRARGNPDSQLLPREFIVCGPPVLDGGDMNRANYSPNPNAAWFLIEFRLTAEGSETFGDLTAQNVGERMAILWGDRVVSDPQINEPIYGGSGQITGQFTEQEAREISDVIREGALPMPLEVLSVSFVGPSLGQASIVNGVVSVIVGFVVVILFIIGYYRLSGFVAVVALLLNLLLMAAILSVFGFTLTLPGFAGVILTVGMAVDANVIIFEKMKEDLRAGRAASIAIENGYAASFWTILDANLTTLIAAVILASSGDAPIRGFAIVLFFGLITSFYTALFVTRLIFDWSYHFFRYRNMSIGYGFKQDAEEAAKEAAA